MKKSFKQIDILLIIAAIILVAGYYGAVLGGTGIRDRWYEEKLLASRLMSEAMAEVRNEKLRRGIPIDRNNDINSTGMIGREWSPITTTLGSLEAKRTSANPEFAAAVVDMLKEVGAEKGDLIAVNLSGSFPALNIAVFSAMEVLDLDADVITSAGASTWGANDPEFTCIDMEQALYEAGILKYRSAAVSLGGMDDTGKEMDEETRQALLERFRKQGRRIIFLEDFGLNIEQRLSIYEEGKRPVKCFINVGGNLLSSGGSEDFTRLGTGVIKERKHSSGIKDKGLVQIFLDRGVPVINLLNIKGLAIQYGIPIDPCPLPVLGEGDIFHEKKYPYAVIVFCLAAALSLLMIYSRRVRR